MVKRVLEGNVFETKFMDKNRSDSRRSAAQAFQKSLEELQNLLQPQDPETEEVSAPESPESLAADEEEELWEEAGGDLEEYFQNQEDDET